MQRSQSVLTQLFVCFLAAQWCKPCWAVAVDVLLCCRLRKYENYRCCQRFLGPANLSSGVTVAAVAACPNGSVREWASCPMVSTASDRWSGCCSTLLDAKTSGIALLTRSSTACKPVFLRFTGVCSVLVRPRTSVFGCPNASHFTLTLAWMLSKVPRVKNSMCTIFELTRRIVRNM